MSYMQLLKDIDTLFAQFKENLIAFIPNFIAAIFIFLLGLLLARIFQVVMNRFIKNLGRITHNEKLQSRIRHLRLERSASLISKVLYWIIIIFFLTAATEILGLPIITTWLSGIVQYLPNILVAILIIFVGIIGSGVLKDLIITTTSTAGLIYADILGKMAQFAILLITILIAINQIGIDIAVLTGFISIILAALLFGASLAFGLGARTSVSNILASYYLQSTYREGQLIQIGETTGHIIQITPTSVILDTTEGQVSVPAKEFSERISMIVRKDP